jgi:fluoride ion exporter CrcB/FEX
MNALHNHLPFGTLVANLVGGYLIGIALGFFSNIRRFRWDGACLPLPDFSVD